MIVDEVRVHLKAGRGGSGSNSFCKRPGGRSVPWGGDGARGGDVIVVATPHLYDLSRLKGRKELHAEDGAPGGSRRHTGRRGKDLLVEVPLGTLVRDVSGKVLADISSEEKKFLAAKGGEGGKGNYRGGVASSGEEGECKELIFDYRIPNDIALVGPPNSGRTSLLNALTGNQYKVAPYPFTTTSCIWGEFEHRYCRIKVLELPAIVEGASKGKGLGNKFLKHLYRTKVVLFVTDDLNNYKGDFKMLGREVCLFDRSLLDDKKFFYLLMKTDKIVTREYPEGVIPMSCKVKEKIDNLKDILVKEVCNATSSSKNR